MKRTDLTLASKSPPASPPRPRSAGLVLPHVSRSNLVNPVNSFNSLSSRRSQTKADGVALVITLILLSVITFMAVTFLVVSRSERGTVKATQDQAAARMSAETAQEMAQAQLLAAVMAFNDPHAVGLMVTTN